MACFKSGTNLVAQHKENQKRHRWWMIIVKAR